MYQSLLLAAAAFQVAPSVPAPAQISLDAEVAAPAPVPGEVPAGMIIIPALTPVDLRVEESLISNTAKIGQEFDIVLASPVFLPGGLAIPAGTPGRGWVIHASKSAIGGKAGELLLGARYLKIGDFQIPLRSMKIGSPQGKDNTGLSMGLSMTIGIAGVFVSGGKAKVDSGMHAYAKTAVDAPVPIALLQSATPTGPALVATLAPNSEAAPAPASALPSAVPGTAKNQDTAVEAAAIPKGTDK